MSAREKQRPESRFYLVSQPALPKLRELAAVAPVLPGERERVEEIWLHLRDAPVQSGASGEHLATLMAFLGDHELLTEVEDEMRVNLELHVHGRVTIYAANAEQRARAAPSEIDVSTLQQYWEDEQLQTTDAGAEIHAALRALHANLVAAGDESVLLVHW
jgi:plasmid stabilization system protein ParE